MAELVTKAQRLEVELDKCKEQLTTRFLDSNFVAFFLSKISIGMGFD